MDIEKTSGIPIDDEDIEKVTGGMITSYIPDHVQIKKQVIWREIQSKNPNVTPVKVPKSLDTNADFAGAVPVVPTVPKLADINFDPELIDSKVVVKI